MRMEKDAVHGFSNCKETPCLSHPGVLFKMQVRFSQPGVGLHFSRAPGDALAAPLLFG